MIIPIYGWNRVAEQAVRFGLMLSDDVTAVHVGTEKDDAQGQKELWADKVEKPAKAANSSIPRLEIIPSPYRMLHQPILDFVNKVTKEKPDRLIAVIIPQMMEPHWYQYLLHGLDAATLRTLLFLELAHRTVVIRTPWYLRKETAGGKI